MKKIISTLVLILIISSTAFCQTDKEYSKTLYEYFEVSGNKATADIALEQMIDIFKPQYPNIKENEWEKIYNDVIKESIKGYIEMMIPIYQKYLSKSDLEEMIKFYQTPIGQKFAQSNALITKELMTISQQWGMDLSKQLMEAIEKANK
ncbi:MAG: DUF2059 domain-containing protein [Bacteroidales bacterium]|nr:DUF2059 domain-containing protein [Bacteroidales bacterium]